MGLLTALSTLFQVGIIVHDDISDANLKSDSKARAIKNCRQTYMDSHGKEYDVNTNRRVYFTIENGDRVYKDVKTGMTVHNISATQRNNKLAGNKAKAIAEGKRFYFDPNRKLFCELSTGKYYRKNYVDNIYWDVEDGNRYCYEFGEGPTDEELEHIEELRKPYLAKKKEYEDYRIYLDYGQNSDITKAREYEKMKISWEVERLKHEVINYSSDIHKKYKKR